MEITHIVFNPNTFGITQKSLKMLRNVLAEKINHRIAIVEIPTDDICCGYFIFDWELQNATWTGDGFRVDGGGEGGAGYRSANILFGLFAAGLIHHSEQVNFDEIYSLQEGETERQLKALAKKIAAEIRDEEFFRPAERQPEYVR